MASMLTQIPTPMFPNSYPFTLYQWRSSEKGEKYIRIPYEDTNIIIRTEDLFTSSLYLGDILVSATRALTAGDLNPFLTEIGEVLFLKNLSKNIPVNMTWVTAFLFLFIKIFSGSNQYTIAYSSHDNLAMRRNGKDTPVVTYLDILLVLMHERYKESSRK